MDFEPRSVPWQLKLLSGVLGRVFPLTQLEMMRWEHILTGALHYLSEVMPLRSPAHFGVNSLIDDPFRRQTLICLWDGRSCYAN